MGNSEASARSDEVKHTKGAVKRRDRIGTSGKTGRNKGRQLSGLGRGKSLFCNMYMLVVFVNICTWMCVFYIVLMALMGLLFSAAAALDFIRVTVYGLDSLVLVGYEALDEITELEAAGAGAAAITGASAVGAQSTDSDVAPIAGDVNKHTCVSKSNSITDTIDPTTSNGISHSNNTTIETCDRDTTPSTTIDTEFITLAAYDLNTNIKYIEIKQILIQSLRICATLWEIKDSESSTNNSNGYNKVMVSNFYIYILYYYLY